MWMNPIQFRGLRATCGDQTHGVRYRLKRPWAEWMSFVRLPAGDAKCHLAGCQGSIRVCAFVSALSARAIMSSMKLGELLLQQGILAVAHAPSLLNELRRHAAEKSA